ncbi:hypothetical protein J3E74DRAFT_322248 [Bipolaris maydis]|nr:hypothetical protein J3E74DRAFT_322248 [Bipolaris maydis]
MSCESLTLDFISYVLFMLVSFSCSFTLSFSSQAALIAFTSSLEAACFACSCSCFIPVMPSIAFCVLICSIS